MPLTQTNDTRLAHQSDPVSDAPRAPVDPSRITVLVADDEPGLRGLLRTIFTLEGYQLLEASDGTEAWHLLQEHRPHVAILDWNMPGYTGDALCTMLKEHPDLAHTPVILLTARTSTRDRMAGQEAGADAYLTKPFSSSELLATVQRLVPVLDS